MTNPAFSKELDSVVISWLEVKNGKAVFQKRTYKELDRAQGYLDKLIATKRLQVSNVQFKICYKIQL